MRWRIWEYEDGRKELRVRDNGHMWFAVEPVESVEAALERIREISGEEPRILRELGIP